jgi:KaiC/GvpD/RAD55 family RecA-like ATPase
MECFCIWTVEEGVHTPALYNILRHIMDVTIELRFEEETATLERKMRVHTCRGSAHSTQWFPFEIKDRGILVIENGDSKADT